MKIEKLSIHFGLLIVVMVLTSLMAVIEAENKETMVNKMSIKEGIGSFERFSSESGKVKLYVTFEDGEEGFTTDSDTIVKFIEDKSPRKFKMFTTHIVKLEEEE